MKCTHDVLLCDDYVCTYKTAYIITFNFLVPIGFLAIPSILADKCTSYDKKMMVLPDETTSSIHITGTLYANSIVPNLHTSVVLIVRSFINLVSYLFKIPGVCGFLSYVINQDCLEKCFEIQRQ